MVNGEETVRLLRRGTIYRTAPEAPGRWHPRHARVTHVPLTTALMLATAGAGLIWVGLQEGEFAVEWPLYGLVWTVLAAWVPHVGWTLESAWTEDVAAGEDDGFVTGYREGYPDGYVDCMTLE